MTGLLALLAGVALLLYARQAQGSIQRQSVPAPDESWDFVGPLPMAGTGGQLPAGGAVPRLVLALNAGQSPKAPPTALYLDPRFRARIDRCVREINAAAIGLPRLGLNSWWRPIGSVGEELSQHHIACAIDVQGPDQEAFAGRLAAMGWTVLRQANDGSPYKHIHAQLERAGLLTRIGVTSDDLKRFG